MRHLRSAIWIGLVTVSTFFVLILFLMIRSNTTSSAIFPEDLPIAESNSASSFELEEKDFGSEELFATTPQWQLSADVWEACAVEEFPKDKEAAEVFLEDLELSENCMSALEGHVLSINPFERLDRHMNSLSVLGYSGYEFSLIILDNPLTYQRIFSDPEGNRAKVIHALSRSECQVEASMEYTRESLYHRHVGSLDSVERRQIAVLDQAELKHHCHPDAFTNYAVFYDACYRESAEYYFFKHQDYFTIYQSEPDRITHMWRGYLEQRWVDEKCADFDSTLQISEHSDPEQFEQLVAIYLQGLSSKVRRDRDEIRGIHPDVAAADDKSTLYNSLLSIGARLGDQAASLTYQGLYSMGSRGIFRQSLGTSTWRELQRDEAPSEKRLQHALDLVFELDKEGINFDWEWLVRHVCSPRGFTSSKMSETENLPSCRSLINDLHLNFASSFRNDTSQLTSKDVRELMANDFRQALPVDQLSRRSQNLAKFEHVAIKLGVFD